MELKPTMILAVLVCIFLKVATGKRVLSYAGPFKAYAEKWYQCPNSKPTDKIGVFIRPHRLAHARALQTVTGNITTHVNFDDSDWILVKLDLWNSNQWKENAFLLKFPRNACSSLRSNIPDLFEKFFRQDPYSKAPCIVSPGSYVVENQPINWTFPNFPVIPYGTYRFKMTLGKEKETLGCTVLECKTQPQV